MDISLIVLGSGQDGGSPQFASTPHGPSRTASSVALRVGDEWILFDASPDLRLQWSRAISAGVLPVRPPRAVAITHAHMGHYAGLVHFGKEALAASDIDLVAPASVVTFLLGNEPWGTLFRDGRLRPRTTETSPYRMKGVDVVGLPAPHRGEFSATVAYSIRIADRPWALYLPDIDSWDAWPDAETTLAAHEIALIDATFSTPDELPGRDLGSIPHPLVPDTVERFAHLTDTTSVVLTHINHTNPLGTPASAERISAERAGFLIAEDGAVFSP